jgi:hypothetical protein
VFESRASDLVSQSDTESSTDLFVRDMLTNQTVLVTVNDAGDTATGGSDPMISGDGRWVVYPDGNNIFFRDVLGGAPQMITVAHDGAGGANGDSKRPVISRNGGWVVFESEATNLVDIPDTNGTYDLFAWRRDMNTIELVTVSADGTAAGSGPSAFTFEATVSDSQGLGVKVAFSSDFTDLVSSDLNGHTDIFVRYLPGGPTVSLTHGANDFSWGPYVSATGPWVAFTSRASDLAANDLNDTYDCFVHDGAGVILVSRNANGTASGNARSECQGVAAGVGFVVFDSYASDLVGTDTNNDEDVFVREVRRGRTSMVSINAAGTDSGNVGSGVPADLPSISANGRFVAFDSWATDLEGVNTDAGLDVYVRDLCLGTTTLMDPNLSGTGSGNYESVCPRLSRNGRWVTFYGRANNLVAIDANGRNDVFRTEVPDWGDWGCGRSNGDVNDNGATTIVDHTMLISYIWGPEPDAVLPDVTGDGVTDSADLTGMIIILTQY